MAYSAEEEQDLAQLKSWWQQNYLLVIITVVLVFAVVFGWRFWQNHQQQKMLQASNQYELLLNSQDNATQVEQLVKQYDNTSYAVFALLDQAKRAVENQQFSQAEQALKQATTQAKDDILLSISALRLATVQYQLQQYDDALASLQQVKGEAWQSRKDLLTGDILLAKGDKQGAKASYQQAQTKATNAFEQQWLEVRLNNL